MKQIGGSNWGQVIGRIWVLLHQWGDASLAITGYRHIIGKYYWYTGSNEGGEMVYTMSKAFRPEGWDNPYIHESEPRVVNLDFREAAYEAGADAMLEGLQKVGKRYEKGEYTTKPGVFGSRWVSAPGYLVFIEEG